MARLHDCNLKPPLGQGVEVTGLTLATFPCAGLHSGPVTAGVLRGKEPSAFSSLVTQLTTARVETSCEKGRIQISQGYT
jgi:class 3 adenylate cyclase